MLGERPDKVQIGASGSIIKNVKSVIVPNTNHLKGMEAAATGAGIAYLLGGEDMKKSSIPLSMHWQLCRELSAMEQKHPAQQRSHPRWMQESLDMRCICRDRNSMEVTGV